MNYAEHDPRMDQSRPINNIPVVHTTHLLLPSSSSLLGLLGLITERRHLRGNFTFLMQMRWMLNIILSLAFLETRRPWSDDAAVAGDNA